MLKINLSTGRRLIVDYDECPENPRTWCEGSRFIAVECRHGFGADETMPGFALDDAAKTARLFGHVVVPVYAHIHSGVVLSLKPFGDPFDSGRCGYLIFPRGYSEAQANDIAQSEIEELNAWLFDEVFAVRVEHPDGFEGVTDDSLSGIYADDEQSAALYAAEELDLTESEAEEIRAAVKGA